MRMGHPVTRKPRWTSGSHVGLPPPAPLGGAGLVLLALDHRHGVSAAEPAVQVDVGAALGAERPQRVHGGLAADRAGFRRGGLVGHERHLGAGWGEGQRNPTASGCWDGGRMVGLARGRPKRKQTYSSTRLHASEMMWSHF